MLNCRVERADAGDVERITPLFDEYRGYYGQESDPEAARQFLEARLLNEESVILMAVTGEGAAKMTYGLAQLYPSFSSLTIQPVWILNDLFVTAGQRGQGIGPQLLEGVRRFAQGTGAKGLTLTTMTHNTGAQRLYEARGYLRDETFFTYNLYF
jgi:GNAT superfamily N-acetyltransferase